jgi:hypothetical protein
MPREQLLAMGRVSILENELESFSGPRDAGTTNHVALAG